MSTIHDHDGTDLPRLLPLIDRIEGVLRDLSTRFDLMATRFDFLDRDVQKLVGENDADSDEEKPEPGADRAHSPVPAIALRSDGKALLSISYVQGADVADRERWEGIVLSVAEAADVFDAISGAADDAAGHTGGRILRHERKIRGEHRDSGGPIGA